MADITLVLRDQFSNKANAIANANKGLSKSMEEVQKKAEACSKKVSALNSSLAKQQTQLQKTKKQLKDAEKAFADCADAANEEALTEAYQKYNALQESISDTRKSAKEARSELQKLNDEAAKKKGGSNGGSGSGGAGESGFSVLLGGLGKSGLGKLVGDTIANVGGYYAQSLWGEDAANSLSGAVSGLATGAAMGATFGSIVPVVGTALGTAIGAAIGLVSGIANAEVEKAKKLDDYYRTSVKESYDAIHTDRDNRLTSGSSVAAQREMDTIAFDTLLGEGVGKAFLSDLRDMAAHTPMEYTDLTSISKTLASGFKDDPDRILSLMKSVGNAGAAVGLDVSGMNSVATALTRMQATGKTTLEYINLMQERGVDAVGMLAEELNATKDQVYERISAGTIEGSKAVDILEKKMNAWFDGAMDKQSKTFSGLQSTLEDQEAEQNALLGSAYNLTRSGGMEAEITHNDSTVGQSIASIRSELGSATALSENKQEDYIRAAETAFLTGEGFHGDWTEEENEYFSGLHDKYEEKRIAWNQAMNQGDEEAAAVLATEINNLLDEAVTYATKIYSKSDLYKNLAEADKDLIDGLQAVNSKGYYELGMEIADKLSAGVLAGVDAFSVRLSGGKVVTTADIYKPGAYVYGDVLPDGTIFGEESHAYGLSRVPYDGYRTVLHEGERVLTANQARQMDRSLPAGGVVITGNTFTIREDADVERIAEALVRELTAAKYTYAG